MSCFLKLYFFLLAHGPFLLNGHNPQQPSLVIFLENTVFFIKISEFFKCNISLLYRIVFVCIWGSVARFFFRKSVFLNLFSGLRTDLYWFFYLVRIPHPSPRLILGLYFQCFCCYKVEEKHAIAFKMEFFI